MNESAVEIRYMLKFHYKKGKNTTQSVKKICEIYGPNAVSERILQNWFKCFQSGNFDVKDEPCSSRPVKVDVILEKVEQDRHISSYAIAEDLSIDRKTIWPI
ncbi:Histone-lysine N-methyltransferase SETMAR [Eumeta japonica]|uniref:Histone-lysine N-methyltransferase SETMAR n=1 Tax=Eumeta variegata TaxID=151549 RepID=A0A4C1UIX2_EUMVA|nr:Histone-lysine N-methyltransferase SETMAR [Eumeta japonica]